MKSQGLHFREFTVQLGYLLVLLGSSSLLGCIQSANTAVASGE